MFSPIFRINRFNSICSVCRCANFALKPIKWKFLTLSVFINNNKNWIRNCRKKSFSVHYPPFGLGKGYCSRYSYWISCYKNLPVFHAKISNAVGWCCIYVCKKLQPRLYELIYNESLFHPALVCWTTYSQYWNNLCWSCVYTYIYNSNRFETDIFLSKYQNCCFWFWFFR